MLQHAKSLLEDESCLVAINPTMFHKLVTALRTAVANEYNNNNYVMSFYPNSKAFPLNNQQNH
jgi:hypothetical protein